MDKLSQGHPPAEARTILTILILNVLFLIFLAIKMLIILYLGELSRMPIDSYLFVLLAISTLFAINQRYTTACFISLIAFFSTAFILAYVYDDVFVANLILLLAPIISVILFKKLSTKIAIFVVSIVLFFTCCYVSSGSTIDNHVFLIGVIPSFTGMAVFYEKFLSIEKNNAHLISVLETKNQHLTSFSNSMSHDLKAPIRTISSYSHLLSISDDTTLGPKGKEYIQLIKSGCKKMAHLVDDLMDFAKAEQATFQTSEVSVDKVIDKVKGELHQEITSSGAVIRSSELPTVPGNTEALFLVFKNLISNSIKFQPNDQPEHVPQIDLYAEQENGYHIISVCDNGIGISEKFKDQLFTPFKRYDSADVYDGTGLGLSISQRIIEKHHGKIELTSDGNSSTCFRIMIPAQPATTT